MGASASPTRLPTPNSKSRQKSQWGRWGREIWLGEGRKWNRTEIIVPNWQLFLIRDHLCPQVPNWGPGRFSNLLGNYWPVILPGWNLEKKYVITTFWFSLSWRFCQKTSWLIHALSSASNPAPPLSPGGLVLRMPPTGLCPLPAAWAPGAGNWVEKHQPTPQNMGSCVLLPLPQTSFWWQWITVCQELGRGHFWNLNCLDIFVENKLIIYACVYFWTFCSIPSIYLSICQFHQFVL